MSLASLKKPARSVERAVSKSHDAIDIDTFIDEAVIYANGGLTTDANNVVAFCHKQSEAKRKTPLKRATFTLGEEAIGQLADLANNVNISRSKLLRMMIAEQTLKTRNG